MESTVKGVYSGYKDTKKIITEEGYEIEPSLNHPLLVMKEDGRLDWVKAEDIKVGDCVPISINNNAWGNKTKLDIDMDSWIETFDNDSSWKILKSKCEVITDLDEEMALIMGYLVGNGCMTRNDSIIFSTQNTDVLENYINFMSGRLGVKVDSKSGENVEYSTNGIYIGEYFSQLGLKQVDAFKKEVPKCIMEAPKEIVSSFIRGLFDVDGKVNRHSIEFCTESEKMSKQIQTILSNFGIICSRSKKYNKRLKAYTYIIFIHSVNMVVYLKEIGFSCERKQDKLKEVCEDEDLKSSSELDYHYSKVKDVTSSKSHVYDLQMEDTHSFIGNGFINHNTMLELMSAYHTCIFYPDIDISMTAQTKESSARLIDSKWKEIQKSYPMIESELKFEPKISKDVANVEFKSGASLTNLSNDRNSLGMRRKRLIIEEYAQVNNDILNEVLEPIVIIPRFTLSPKGTVSPYEINANMIYITTSWYVKTPSYEKNIEMYHNMLELKGDMVLGSKNPVASLI